MQYWAQFIDNPNVSEAFRAHAQRQYALGEHNRVEQQAQEQETYKNKRELWEKDDAAYKKHIREAHDREVEQSIKLNGLELTRANIAEAYHKAGRPREQALEQADIDIAKGKLAIQEAQQKVAAGVRDTVDGRIIRYGEGGVPGDITPKPVPEDIKPNEYQAKELKFLERAIGSRQQFGDLKALTGLKDATLAATPFAGNYFASPAYQAQHAAAFRWISAVLRD
jgi:hypothetical protein